ncbi:LamG domain-containing protein [Bremerella sp. P1]|uniref:LamG domain-containing protein n=1 Tax=Bremerella sp. P1 TaxID=3026424 RepID=UPI0023683550|nr:LamG domain-containing protein [Bremerella sp. P1]WDI43755.1 LamG domain-containing protein [Bremerella sp. P1]
MNEQHQLIEQLDHWLLKVSEGTATPEETHHFNELLASNASLREYAAKRLIDDSLLVEHLRESAAESILRGQSVLPGEGTETQQTRSRFYLPMWSVVSLAIAVSILLILTLPQMFDGTGAKNSSSPVDVAENSDSEDGASLFPTLDADAVATLTRAVDVQWAEGQSPLHIDASLRPKRIRLNEGLIQLEFFSGATVVVEGPAEFVIESALRCRLLFGKVRADVPMQARGFTIAHNSLDAVDLGTEFAMRVEKSGNGEIHVLEGDVSLRTRDGKEKRKLKVGEAVSYDADGVLTTRGAESDSFVGIEKLRELDRERRDHRFQRWLKQRDQWANDPDVVLYYDFQQANQDNRRLLSAINGASESEDGAIIGCQWRQGRFAGKYGLEFKRISDRVRVNVPGEFDSLSMVVWLRIEGADRWYNSLLLTDGWDKGEPHWQITHEGKLQLGVQGGGNYNGPVVVKPSHLGHWVQLATVYDHKRGVIDFYRNGVLTRTSQIRDTTVLRIGDAEIGNWRTPKSGDLNIRSLNGLIDEIAVFSRPLTSEEILSAFNAGNPDQ